MAQSTLTARREKAKSFSPSMAFADYAPSRLHRVIPSDAVLRAHANRCVNHSGENNIFEFMLLCCRKQ